MKKRIGSLFTIAASYLAFLCLNNVVFAPLSLSLFVALLYSGVPPLLLAPAYFIASVSEGYTVSMISSAVQATFIGIVFLLYERKKRLPGVEIILYVFVSSCVYLLFDERAAILNKLVYTAIITLFSGTATIAVKTFSDKGFSVGYKKGETLCAAALLMIVGAGFYRVFGAEAYKGLSIFLVLCSVALYEDETSAIFTAFLALVYLLVEGEAKYLLPYACYYVAAYSTIDRGKIIATVFTVSVETLFAFVFDFYDVYGYSEALFFAVPCVIFALIPQRSFDRKKEYLSPENAMTKASLSEMRAFISKWFSEGANSFSQMRSALISVGVGTPSDKSLSVKIAKSVKKTCENCAGYKKCLKTDAPSIAMLEKIARVGIAKKRITIIDLPKDLLDHCVYPNNVIFEVNRLIEAFSEIKERSEKTDALKNILSVLAGGMEESMRAMSEKFSSVVSFDTKLEKELLKEFAVSGIKIKGISVASDERDREITLLYRKKKFDESAAGSVLGKKFGVEFTKHYSADVGPGVTAAIFREAPKLSCAYGVTSITKFASEKNGDMHSVERLKNSKILFALSDGMGSGDNANKLSDAAISLIEAFYKIGFSSGSLLPLVNKILSSVTEDGFSAVDVCVFDTNSGRCDFIKIGAPYGFILSKEGVRFLEGSSLPLGILDVLTPTVAQTILKKGDILIFLSDGVTDAFGSSSDVIDYLKTAPIYNPQELSDSVVKKALDLSGGVAEDDMTAFCVRIF